MYRGTTPSLTFNIKTELDLTEIAECWVTFKSKSSNKVQTYTLDDLIIDSEAKKITIPLTQEDEKMIQELLRHEHVISQPSLQKLHTF